MLYLAHHDTDQPITDALLDAVRGALDALGVIPLHVVRCNPFDVLLAVYDEPAIVAELVTETLTDVHVWAVGD